MRFPIRPIVIGLLIGAALYFMPFRFPFIFLFIFIFFFSRFFFRPWRGRGYGWRNHDYDYRNNILPIDGYGNNRTSDNKEPEKEINIQ